MNDDDKSEYSAEWWVKEAQASEKELDQNWRTSGDKIVKKYLDERDDGDAVRAIEDAATRKYNIFWANTQILKSALYASPPKPVVKRIHDDPKDDAARVGALMLQRMLTFGMLQDNSDMHRAFQNATEDRLIPGLGQVWLRLRTEFAKEKLPAITDPLSGAVIEPETTIDRIVDQEVCTDYVQWRDFIWSPARVWSEVWWVGRRVWMTRSNFIKRFGEEKYKAIKKDITLNSVKELGFPKGFEKNRIQVLELWCKENKKAYWLQEQTKTMLDERDDPLKLRDFFPCPQPLLATHTTNSLVPRPDYAMVQDQYEELNVLNSRISILTKALRVVGAYDSKNTALQQMITGGEFNMIPVDNWAMLAEQGGMKGVVDWFPIEQVGNVLDKLVQLRPMIVEQIYELTSISDIMRGATNARETLGAQKLKAQYSSVRLQLTQKDQALFVTNAMKIKCEIISKHMDPQQIVKQSAIEITESAELVQQGLDFIKNLNANEFRVEISEESLSMADYTAERELRIAYLTSVGQFLSQSGQMVTAMPAAIPYIIRMIMWVTASFRGSDDIETVLDQAATSAQENPPQGQEEQAPPDFTLQVAQVKADTDKQTTQMSESAKIEVEKIRVAADENIKREEIASKERIEKMKIEEDREANIRDNNTKIEVARIQAGAKIHGDKLSSETTLEAAETAAETRQESSDAPSD